MSNWSKKAIEQAWNDFPSFLYIVWQELRLPPPTEMQMDMAKYLQSDKDRRKIIEAFRGIGKSYITCAFVVWKLWKNRNLRVEIISATGDRADANARFIKKIIMLVPFLEDMAPTDGQLNQQNVFEVGGAIADASPSVKSVGITGQITGSRADLLISDDVEIPKNSATQQQRDKLKESVKEFDAILKPKGTIIYLGTPQVESSLYNELLKRGYVARIWPVQVPTESESESYNGNLAPIITSLMGKKPAGTPTDPKRFTQQEIQERMLSYGKAGFSLQFMLNTNLSDAQKYPLRCSDLIISALDNKESSYQWAWTSNPINTTELPCVGLRNDNFYRELSRSKETQKYTGCVMAVDASGRGSDETAYAVIKFLGGYLFVMEVDGMQDGYSDMTLLRLAQRAKYWGVNEVVLESNFGDGIFTQLFKPMLNKVYPCKVSEVRNSVQKERRMIDTLEPVMMQHKMIVNESVVMEDFRRYQIDEKYSLFYQMTRLSIDRGSLAHDDRLDALTMAVSYWTSQMNNPGISENPTMPIEYWLDEIMDGDGLLNMVYNGNGQIRNQSVKAMTDLRKARQYK